MLCSPVGSDGSRPPLGSSFPRPFGLVRRGDHGRENQLPVTAIFRSPPRLPGPPTRAR